MTLRTSMAALIAGLTLAGPALAAPFTSDWYTIDGGGGTLSGGSFTISGTIGQADAGAPAKGGNFRMAGGYWQSSLATSCRGDVNGDGRTNAIDFTIVAANYTAGPNWDLSRGDLNDDGFVNATDFTILAGDYGCITP